MVVLENLLGTAFKHITKVSSDLLASELENTRDEYLANEAHCDYPSSQSGVGEESRFRLRESLD